MIFRLGELFCGPGGLAWGAMNADIGLPNWGIVHAWANDYDSDTCKTYIRNICPDSPDTVFCEDVHQLDLLRAGIHDIGKMCRPGEHLLVAVGCSLL